MKVKARVNGYTDDRDCCGHRFINLDISTFSIPENVKIENSKFKEIEFDIPVINELEKYSSNDLQKELLRREKEFPKPFAFCCKCKSPIFAKNFSSSYNHQLWYYCPHCNENVLAEGLLQ